MNATTVRALGLLLVLSVTVWACGPGDEVVQDGGPSATYEDTVTSSMTEPAPPAEASAGTPVEDAHVNPRPVLASGAAGAPDAPPLGGWSPQFAAQHLVDNGLTYDDGVEHAVSYAECTGSPDHYSSGRYTVFSCYVESPSAAPYWITLEALEGSDRALFWFDGYAR